MNPVVRWDDPNWTEGSSRPGRLRHALPLLEQPRRDALLGAAARGAAFRSPRLLRLPMGARPLRTAGGPLRALPLRLLPEHPGALAFRDVRPGSDRFFFITLYYLWRFTKRRARNLVLAGPPWASLSPEVLGRHPPASPPGSPRDGRADAPRGDGRTRAGPPRRFSGGCRNGAADCFWRRRPAGRHRDRVLPGLGDLLLPEGPVLLREGDVPGQRQPPPGVLAVPCGQLQAGRLLVLLPRGLLLQDAGPDSPLLVGRDRSCPGHAAPEVLAQRGIPAHFQPRLLRHQLGACLECRHPLRAAGFPLLFVSPRA